MPESVFLILLGSDQQQQLGTFSLLLGTLRPNSELLIPAVSCVWQAQPGLGTESPAHQGKLGRAFPPQPPWLWEGVRGAQDAPWAGESSASESQIDVSGHRSDLLWPRQPRGRADQRQPPDPCPAWVAEDRDSLGSDDGAGAFTLGV